MVLMDVDPGWNTVEFMLYAPLVRISEVVNEVHSINKIKSRSARIILFNNGTVW